MVDAKMWDENDPIPARALKFTDDELDAFGSYILAQDYIWNVYNEELKSNIGSFIAEVLNEEVK